MNEYQKRRFAQTVVSSMFNTITNKKLAVLGFAFKKDTGDTRETPSATVCRFFRQENAKVSIYDPKVPEKQIFVDLTEPGVADDSQLGASLSLLTAMASLGQRGNECASDSPSTRSPAAGDRLQVGDGGVHRCRGHLRAYRGAFSLSTCKWPAD